MEILIIIFIVSVLTGAGIVVWVSAPSTPLGYQSEDGFHQASLDGRARRTQVADRAAAQRKSAQKAKSPRRKRPIDIAKASHHAEPEGDSSAAGAH